MSRTTRTSIRTASVREQKPHKSAVFLKRESVIRTFGQAHTLSCLGRRGGVPSERPKRPKRPKRPSAQAIASAPASWFTAEHFPHPVSAGSETGGGSGPIFHTLRDAITPAVESGDFTNHMMYKEIKMIKRVSHQIGNDLTTGRALVFRPRLDLDNTATNRREARYE